MHETEELVYAGNEAENSTSTADLLQATELSGKKGGYFPVDCACT